MRDGPGQVRLTPEENATAARKTKMADIRQDLGARNAEIEKRFGDLYTRKNALSTNKYKHGIAAQRQESLQSEINNLREEIVSTNESIRDFGGKIAAGNRQCCEDIGVLYPVAKQLDISLKSKNDELSSVSRQIIELAPYAEEYDQVVVLIEQMNEFFQKLSSALSGVLNGHRLPAASPDNKAKQG